jgi:excisionase family DNA binding protein
MERKRLVGLRELADHLGLSPWTVYGLVRKDLNGIPRYKIGRQWRFDLDEVDRWIRETKRK